MEQLEDSLNKYLRRNVGSVLNLQIRLLVF